MMIDLAEKCHAEIVALNERHRAKVATIMARCQTELDRAREDHLAELTEIEFNARIAMDKRLESFRGAGSDPAKEPPVEETKSVIQITAPKPTQQAHLIGDEGDPRGMPGVVGGNWRVG